MDPKATLRNLGIRRRQRAVEGQQWRGRWWQCARWGPRIGRSGTLMSPDQSRLQYASCSFKPEASLHWSFLSLAMNAPPPPYSGAEPGFGTMCSNQGAGRGRFGGSLSPDHCLTHQTQWRAERRQGGVGGGRRRGRRGMIMEFSHSFLSTGPPCINYTLLKNGTLSIQKS